METEFNDLLAARLHKPKSPLELENVPIPEVGGNDVLVKIKASGVCHSNLHIISGATPPLRYPITLGHEGAGVVEKVGERVRDVRVGERVGLYYMTSCGHCYYCSIGKEYLCDNQRSLDYDIDGTFAEYVCLPSRSMMKLPDRVSFPQAAITGCAVVTAFHATAVGGLKPGSTVAIYGIGGVGFHGVQHAKLFGALRVIAVDISKEKLALAKEAGADEVVNASQEDPVERIRELTGGKGVDVAFEYIGLKGTIEQAINSIRKGGVAVMVGISGSRIEIDQFPFLSKEAELRTAWGNTREELARLLNLIDGGRIDLSKSITHTFPLKDVNRALEVLEKRIGNPMRIVLIP